MGAFYAEKRAQLNDIVVNQRLLKKQLRIYKKAFPELLEEVRGIANGGNFDLEKTQYACIAQHVDFWRKRCESVESCTIFGVKTKDGLIVGRNYDWLASACNFFRAYEINPARRNKYLCISDMDIYDPKKITPDQLRLSVQDAINDSGLYIGLTFAHNHRWGYGLSPSHIIRLVAETCQTVDDAISLFRRVPLSGAKNYFIADKTGNMTVIEHNSKRFGIVRPDNQGILVKTNHYLASSMVKEDAINKDKPASTSYIRFAEALQYINEHKERFDAQCAVRLLRNGAFVYENNLDHCTIWSLAMNMTRKNYKLYYGRDSKEKSERLVI